MISQSLLPFQYVSDKTETHLTSFAGLPLYWDLAIASGLCALMNKLLTIKTQGWSDLQIVMSLVMLNLAGGDCVDDIARFEQDKGLSTLLLHFETHGMRRKARRAYENRWRKNKARAFPSTAAILRYLEQFHEAIPKTPREAGTAFIPTPNEALQKLGYLNTALIQFAQQRKPNKVATLDQDATLAVTHKETAFYCYTGYKAYQPFNTYWLNKNYCFIASFEMAMYPLGLNNAEYLKRHWLYYPKGSRKFIFAQILPVTNKTF
jgi:hypothetical protein